MLELNDLSVHFKLQGSALARLFGFRARLVRAVDDVSVSLKRGEVLGLVGESGSGKTTLGRALLGLVPATEGEIHYHGKQGDRLVSDMRGTRAPPAANRPADGLPGPQRGAQPVDDHRGSGRASAGDPWHRQGCRAAPPGRGGAGAGRPVAGRQLPEQVPVRPLGRPEAAGRDRAGDHPRPRGAGGRRAGVDARHERARQDHPADDRPQARPGAHLRLHHPRPRVARSSSATGSRSCTSAGSWRSARPRRSSPTLAIRTRRRC